MLIRHWKLCGAVVLFCSLVAMLPLGQQVGGGQSTKKAAKSAGDWWSIPDTDFVTQYGDLATGTQEQQSKFAWMAFARANQQVAGTNKQQFSQWELWASDDDTFTPDTPRFIAAKKIRTRPHLQPIQQNRMFSAPMTLNEKNPFPLAGQEVTRNPTSYNYILNNSLNTQAGIAAYLGNNANQIQFPLGSVETKAVWVNDSIAGAYQSGGLSLTALHLMVKVKPTPANPFTDNSPSWFWTTFEFKANQGLAAAQKFITYGDALLAADTAKLLTQAGLGKTAFTNYVSNGVQIQFSDSNNKTIILGNTQLEYKFAIPRSTDPTTWQSWSSSCHSCHAQASGIISGNGVRSFDFTAPVGPLVGTALPPAGYRPYDFVWALSLAQ